MLYRYIHSKHTHTGGYINGHNTHTQHGKHKRLLRLRVVVVSDGLASRRERERRARNTIRSAQTHNARQQPPPPPPLLPLRQLLVLTPPPPRTLHTSGGVLVRARILLFVSFPFLTPSSEPPSRSTTTTRKLRLQSCCL